MTDSTTKNSKRLYRSTQDRLLAGVCGGLGEYLDVDPTIVRLVFILICLAGGSGLLIYLILWLVIPSDKDLAMGAATETVMKKNAAEMKQKAKAVVAEFKTSAQKSTTQLKTDEPQTNNHRQNLSWLGIVLITWGGLLLLRNLGWLPTYLIWPVVLMVLGLFVLTR